MHLLLPLLLSVAAAPSPTPLPPQIAAHVHDGHFDPGDYGWLRGSFPGASAAEQASWQAIKAYTDHCADAAPRDKAALEALGHASAHAEYWRHYASDICAEAGMAGWVAQGFADWPGFRRALDAALPVYRSYVFAVDQAVAVVPGDEGELRDQLHVLIVPDQMLREALSWGQGEAAGAPPLDPQATHVLGALLWRPIRDRDHRNTAWLKALVDKQGWPTISQVGKLAADHAWVLVQHADDDPLFQLRVLRLMEPLAAKGEVDKGDYALLTDRVLLPLTGKQRYGTQFTCGDKGWQPLPLEDQGGVDTRRAAMGMPPLADYRRQMIATYGETCRR